MNDTELRNWLVNYFGVKVVPSKISPDKYNCIICSNKLPKEVRGKAYKWSETEVCIGSFDKSLNIDVIGYFNKAELEKFLKYVELKESHELLIQRLKDLVACVNGGYYSTLAEEVRNAEHTIEEAESLAV